MTCLNFHMSRNILSIARMAETVGNQLLTGIMPPDKDGDSYHVPPLVTWSYVVECAYSRQPFTHHMHTYKVMQRNTRQTFTHHMHTYRVMQRNTGPLEVKKAPDILQGMVVTHVSCGGIIKDNCIARYSWRQQTSPPVPPHGDLNRTTLFDVWMVLPPGESDKIYASSLIRAYCLH